MELNTGSTSCVNQIFTSVGELVTVLPTFGSAWSKKACAQRLGLQAPEIRRIPDSNVELNLFS